MSVATSATTKVTLLQTAGRVGPIKEGKFIGTGEPPAGHYWTQRNAAELKQKKAAMVKKTPPQQTPPQQQQQQPAQIEA